MTDTVQRGVRSRMMAAVRGRDTAPERAVRRELFANGFRYRLHRKDLPGTPDIVLAAYNTVVFVHGCFWHGHDCPRGRRPASNTAFWDAKLERNQCRDRENHAALESAGWKVITVWECDIVNGLKRLLEDLDERRQARLRSLAKELTR